MRNIAPEREGNAVNKKSWSVVKLNPILLRLTATALNNIQTQNARSKQLTEIHKFLLAMPFPLFSQKAGFSGRQSLKR
ncbi:hypothetical protein SEN777SA01_04420 [Salmonella enterica subsp. enterica serovar Agona]|uniref:hypothetical protein n=1 Tax=Salmonella enterica TaxID=28901 RepID=UPI0003BADCBB|nr:hypothetical protein [Salmonella enterica]ESB62245.1 hypothetical protein SEEA7571_18832 [Salmonella enterica subsp. enterica serovar Agona str. 266757-1]ESC33769.1 hypothetical protein SEEACDC1_05442 [Salmonella enterica subsp. enterica serovar Agona str. SA-1]ESO46557.1 hypothetical protein SEEA8691_15693 [Salmonella enterica subsp. enterica serovar Agona str. 392869-1]CAH2828065.1 hypothetical protein SEN777SA01_04420 [Salmonella enterica subsp. enterica serovar Agona]